MTAYICICVFGSSAMLAVSLRIARAVRRFDSALSLETALENHNYMRGE